MVLVGLISHEKEQVRTVCDPMNLAALEESLQDMEKNII
jgi:hypothetical protein